MISFWWQDEIGLEQIYFLLLCFCKPDQIPAAVLGLIAGDICRFDQFL